MRDVAPRAVIAIGHALEEQIKHGLLVPGAKLPAERALSELFETTRITLREALLQLEARGLVYREERRGWFVSPPRLTYDLNERSHFHAMARRHGRQPATELITARAQAAPAVVCDYLNLPPLARVYRICRARRIDNRLVLYVEHYLNPEYFPELLTHDLGQPLTELYAQVYGIAYGQAQFELLPTALPTEAARALKVSAGSPGLRITRVNHDTQGRLIDCDLEYWRHDAIRVVTTVKP